MSDNRYKIATVLDAVSTFIAHHDKEDYEGIFIIARQRNDVFQLFSGGTAGDPDFLEEWQTAPYFLESFLNDQVEEASNFPQTQLQWITNDNVAVQPEQTGPNVNNIPETLQEVYQKSLHPGTRLNDEGELIDDPGILHPRLNDKGEWVTIYHPIAPTPMSAFEDPDRYAVMLPNGQAPKSLHGIAFQPWQNIPKSLAEWAHVEGQSQLEEPSFIPKHGKKLAAGVVILEPDGRCWLVAPTNAFGGYKATFPKGRLESGMTPQATAIKEAYEEAGLQVEITAYIGDFERSTTLTRYYLGRRIGGLPTRMQWESQAVMLVPKSQLLKVLNHPTDHTVIEALNQLNFSGVD
jgi:ADP-ribose pyrophosphatase YjhB (NUDIX family)